MSRYRKTYKVHLAVANWYERHFELSTRSASACGNGYYVTDDRDQVTCKTCSKMIEIARKD